MIPAHGPKPCLSFCFGRLGDRRSYLFIKSELLPAIHKLTGIEHFASTAFAGFSLGGLSALDIAWHNPELFDKAGIFSGSFWWRSKDLNKGYTDSDRIMHSIIRQTQAKPGLKIWLQTGTKDETADRNKNGIIDSIDDTVDLIEELELKALNALKTFNTLKCLAAATIWQPGPKQCLSFCFGRLGGDNLI